MKSFWVGSLFRLFILLLLFSGCARSEAVRLPNEPLLPTLPTGKTLRSLPEFSVVDDFDTQDTKNRLGAPWEAETEAPEGLAFEFDSEDPPSGKHGSVLTLTASLPPEAKGVFKSSLKGKDMSQAQALVLRCKVETPPGEPFSGRIALELRDLEERIDTHDLTSSCLPEKSGAAGWKEVIFPRSFFVQTDWNRLEEIMFTITAGPRPLHAKIGLDEIAFYGKGDVAFLSQKDNLVGFPEESGIEERVTQLLAEPESEKFLYEIARDTWKYFENALDRNTQLPVDHLRVGTPGEVGSYTTPTNLAMYFLACVSAHELGFISRKDALKRIQRTMETLRLVKRWNGFHYNFYDTGNLQVTRPYVSVIDAGWLASAWMVLRQAFPKELGGLATRFLDEGDFSEFYDPSVGQLRLGFDEETGNFSPYHYGLLATEARVASFIGIGKGDLPRQHWWLIYRTPPKEWTWQSQTPEGKEVTREGTTVFEGHYTYQGRKFVPSWGGSLFEFLMPTLVMKEKELAPKGLGLNNRIATEVHIDYALNRQGYPVWGISPASISSGRLWHYGEYGVKYLGVKGYRDEGIVTPYGAFLALDTLPDQAIDNLRKMLQEYAVYGEYGFYDSVNVRNGRVNTQYLALDQGMILAAIANYLRGGVLKEYFHKDGIAKASETLLSLEDFFTSPLG